MISVIHNNPDDIFSCVTHFSFFLFSFICTKKKKNIWWIEMILTVWLLLHSKQVWNMIRIILIWKCFLVSLTCNSKQVSTVNAHPWAWLQFRKNISRLSTYVCIFFCFKYVFSATHTHFQFCHFSEFNSKLKKIENIGPWPLASNLFFNHFLPWMLLFFCSIKLGKMSLFDKVCLLHCKERMLIIYLARRYILYRGF